MPQVDKWMMGREKEGTKVRNKTHKQSLHKRKKAVIEVCEKCYISVRGE